MATIQRRAYAEMFGPTTGDRVRLADTELIVTFMSQAGVGAGLADVLGLHKRVAAVKGIRGVQKRHMVHNACAPKMEIDAQTYDVRADGVLLTCEAATVLPMAQRYFPF